MADGRIVIEIDADGKPIRSVNNELDSLEGKASKSTRGIKDFVVALGAVKVASAAFNVLKNSMTDAVSRFDTMQKYPKVMSALGFSTEDSNKSVKRLADGIDGLPTRLDTVVSTAQRMTAITGNMNKSTDATIALNNAMLASGASTDDASRGLQQYIQMLSTGKVDLQSWKTLQETMPIGLQKTAEAMGFVGESAQRDLYAALKDGKITFNDFQNQLIKLGTGTGELAKLAKLNSEGIGTSFENLKSAVVKGLANIMTALDNVSKAATGKSIAKNLDSLKAVINSTFSLIVQAIEMTIPAFKKFSSVLGEVISAIKPYTPAITGFVQAITAMLIIRSVANAFASSETAIRLYLAAVKAAEVATKLYTLATSAQARQQLALTVLDKAQAVSISVTTAALAAKNTIIGILTGTTSLATVATTAFGVAIKTLLGPIGWITAAIGLLVAGGVALWKQLNKDSEEVVRLKKAQEGLVESSEQLAEDTDRNIQNRKDEITMIDSSVRSHQALIAELDALSQKENKTTAEKNKMKKTVEELNNSVAGLNLTYDAQSDKLSQIPAKITEQVAAFAELDKARESQEQLNEIIGERNEIESKLAEINEQRRAWNKEVGDSPIAAKKAQDAIKELDTQEAALKKTQSELQTEFQNTARIHAESINNASAAVEAGVFKQQVTYDSLNEKQKEVMDSMRAEYQSLQDKATNAFEEISVKSAISTEQMIANLQKNQETIAAWADNIAALADRGVNQGLLEQLRNMGPEGAAYTAELVNASDEQLQRLNEVYGNGGATAMTALSQSLQLGKQGVNEEVATIIPEAQQTLQGQVKAADFGSVGRDITDTVRAEIDSSKRQVADAAGSVVDGAATKAKEKAGSGDFKTIGGQIPKGMKEGIEGGKKEAENAAGGMATGISTVAKDKLGVHSPSRVFQEIGSNVVSGLRNGIQSNSESAKQAMSSVVDKVVSASENVSNKMQSAGRNAMSGLAAGISNNAHLAINAAQNVANQITSTIQNALDIHSPSRVMRDKVGKYIPQGIALGIDKDAERVYNSMRNLMSGMTITPELALGTGQIGKMSTMSQIVNNSSVQPIAIDNRGLLEGATFHIREEADVAKLAKEFDSYTHTKAIQNGYRRVTN